MFFCNQFHGAFFVIPFSFCHSAFNLWVFIKSIKEVTNKNQKSKVRIHEFTRYNLLSIFINQSSVRIYRLIVKFAVFILSRINDVFSTLKSQFYSKLRPPVFPRHQILHLKQNIFVTRVGLGNFQNRKITWTPSEDERTALLH